MAVSASRLITFIFLLSAFSAKSIAQVPEYNSENSRHGDSISDKYNIIVVKLGSVVEIEKKEAAVTAGLNSGLNFSGDFSYNMGLAAEKYSNALFLPVYAGLRRYIPDISHAKAYLFMEAGYAIGFVSGVSGNDQGGPFAAAGFGAGGKISNAIMISGELGFKYHHHQKASIDDRKQIIVALALTNFRARDN